MVRIPDPILAEKPGLLLTARALLPKPLEHSGEWPKPNYNNLQRRLSEFFMNQLCHQTSQRHIEPPRAAKRFGIPILNLIHQGKDLSNSKGVRRA